MIMSTRPGSFDASAQALVLLCLQGSTKQWQNMFCGRQRGASTQAFYAETGRYTGRHILMCLSWTHVSLARSPLPP